MAAGCSEDFIEREGAFIMEGPPPDEFEKPACEPVQPCRRGERDVDGPPGSGEGEVSVYHGCGIGFVEVFDESEADNAVGRLVIFGEVILKDVTLYVCRIRVA